MEYFLTFLKDNYYLVFGLLGSIILVLLLLLLILLLVFLPKRFNKYWSSLLSMLPLFIKKCEDSHVVGSENKLNFVLSLACNYLSALTGLKIETVVKRFYDLISVEVEKILSTPQKKEVL